MVMTRLTIMMTFNTMMKMGGSWMGGEGVWGFVGGKAGESRGNEMGGERPQFQSSRRVAMYLIADFQRFADHYLNFILTHWQSWDGWHVGNRRHTLDCCLHHGTPPPPLCFPFHFNQSSFRVGFVCKTNSQHLYFLPQLCLVLSWVRVQLVLESEFEEKKIKTVLISCQKSNCDSEFWIQVLTTSLVGNTLVLWTVLAHRR